MHNSPPPGALQTHDKHMIIALLGAESTGKSALTHALVRHLQERGVQAVAVDEYLREWCAEHGRTPQPHEQVHIAETHQRRIQAAAAQHSVVIADTTPLMIAIYSDLLFDDRSLYDMALAHQRTFDLTLVTGLDLPWVADGLQRDGPHVREPVDALLRAALAQGNIPYHVVYGSDALRTENALKSVETYRESLKTSKTPSSRRPTTAAKVEEAGQTWVCERCSDPECEHRLFTSLLQNN